MFLEEIQRTIQQRYFKSGSEKQFVFNKVPESVFLTWLFQQYELLQQLQIASNETYCSASSPLSEMLLRQNCATGFKTLASTGDRSKPEQDYSSLCYPYRDRHAGASQRTDMKQNSCQIKMLGSLPEVGDSISSAFCQISLSGKNGNRFPKRRTICQINEATVYAEKPYLVNKQRYLESTENHIHNINVDSCEAHGVRRYLFCPEESKTFVMPTSLHFSIIPRPFFYSNNPSSTLEIRNNNNNYYYYYNKNNIFYPVPHISKTISPSTARSHTFQPTCVLTESNDQNDHTRDHTRDHTLDQSLCIKNCSESNPSLPLFVVQSDSSLGDPFHSTILSSMDQFNEDRLDDECCNAFNNPLDPPAPRDLQNPVAKLLSNGDDMHFIPIEEEILEQQIWTS